MTLPEQPQQPSPEPVRPSSQLLVGVVFNNPLRTVFTYLVPPEWETRPPIGSRVLAPLGKNRQELGIVVEHPKQTDVAPSKLRCVQVLIDEDAGILPAELLTFIRWVADYYESSLGEALFAAFPFGRRTTTRRTKIAIPGPLFDQWPGDVQRTPQRQQVCQTLAESLHMTTAASLPAPGSQTQPPTEKGSSLTGIAVADLARLAGVSVGVVTSLAQAGVLQIVETALACQALDAIRSQAEELYSSPRVQLNADQTSAVASLQGAIQSAQHQVFLLHGVTGSGKTEVFLHAIEETLRTGKEALVLVPEIALTPQTAARYRARFPGQVVVLHSGLRTTQRFEAWSRVRRGEVPVVVGTRSAVFAPLSRLGLIIVDEEHDGSYKQADPAPRYHGRDAAVYRAWLESCPVVLGSATPSLESYENALKGKYQLLNLPQRATGHCLPQVDLVDMRQRGPEERILSHPAREAIGQTLEMGLQSILFLNRRGHSTLFICRECGQAIECPDCSVSLVWHQDTEVLLCHYCGHQEGRPERCPHCQAPAVRARGHGTQQVAELVQNLFPEARVARIDLDTTRQEGAHDRILAELRKGQIDILVGTQMVSKGLDMPGVRLVVVIQADTALNIEDFRSAERTFALLTQVAGRAGRGDHHGQVLVQSYSPQHYSVYCALQHDYIGFRRREIKFRYHLNLPPFSRLVCIRCDGEDSDRVMKHADKVSKVLRSAVLELDLSGSRVMGPTPCPLERLIKRYRWQVFIATPTAAARSALLSHPSVRELVEKNSPKLRTIIDVDPINLL